MFLSRTSLPSEEYHIIILVEELCEMEVKADMALHVDVTGPGKRLGWLNVSVMTHVSDSCYISLLTLVEYTHPWVNRGRWWLVRRGSWWGNLPHVHMQHGTTPSLQLSQQRACH